MKKFWKDYVDLCKHSNEFYKKHWFGILMINVVGFAAIYGYFTKDYIKAEVESYINDKKNKES